MMWQILQRLGRGSRRAWRAAINPELRARLDEDSRSFIVILSALGLESAALCPLHPGSLCRTSKKPFHGSPAGRSAMLYRNAEGALPNASQASGVATGAPCRARVE